MVLKLYLILELRTIHYLFLVALKCHFWRKCHILIYFIIHIQLKFILLFMFFLGQCLPFSIHIFLIEVRFTFYHVTIVDRETEFNIILVAHIDIRLIFDLMEWFWNLSDSHYLILELSHVGIIEDNEAFGLGEFDGHKVEIKWCCRPLLYLQVINLTVKLDKLLHWLF